ncbi:uncharacterized protein BXZ73DRAFT_53857 [Epithele typhae]|uniref:uncharacterized protein n=1 Tax=Epithele typhae TaxID=378194 RepID=UPI00200834C9|nr:uncharacterized protein BXZ73DRAFT_53857 [Epithele typhae]KAH9916283.1 hypothetical protein BXZ73DRAFT_53857 [Epithele typhae]
MVPPVLATVVRVSRPAGWAFGPILFAIGLVHSPHGSAGIAKYAALQLFSLSFPLALVVFGVNDVYDYPSDARNPRKLADALEGTVLLPEFHPAVTTAAWIATAFISATSLLSARRANISVVTVLLALAWQYSAPPLRFKERPVLDSLSNGAIVDLAYLAGYTAGGGALDARMLRLRGHVLGLCTAGVHALGAAVDVAADAAVGQRTIATVYGPRAAAAFGLFNFLFAFAVERSFSVFGVYILGGIVIMSSVIVDLGLSHLAFQTVVYWTVIMSVAWFVQKATSFSKHV